MDTRQVVDSLARAENTVHLFPGGYSYPTVITFLGRVILIYFCMVRRAARARGTRDHV
jgi:hypothetical protein